MIKLFTLEDLSAFSADAVYKICLALDGYGFSEEDRQSFEGVDALLTAASFAVEDGDDVVLAAENDGYLALKAKLLEKLQLEPASVPSIAERIAQKHSGEDGIDMRAQCLVPKGSVTHLTEDGLFSGFTAAVQNGTSLSTARRRRAFNPSPPGPRRPAIQPTTPKIASITVTTPR